MNEIDRIWLGFAIICGGAILLTLALHFGAKYAEHRGWIVKRTEPIPELEELARAIEEFGRVCRAEFKPIEDFILRTFGGKR